MTPTAPVNTRKAARRTVRYETLEAYLADIERLAAADRAGTLRATGNWTLGRALGHVAGWSDCFYVGFPKDLPPTAFVLRLMMKFFRGHILSKGFPPGIVMNGVENGTKFTERLPLDDALTRVHATVRRLRSETPSHPSPALDPMTPDESRALFLRHAELHLSFFHA
jgi:hypothetical protein